MFKTWPLTVSAHRQGGWNKLHSPCIKRGSPRPSGILQWHPAPVLLPGNATDGGAWWAAVHGVSKSQTPLSDFTFSFHFPTLEKAMATHSSVPAWRIPGTGEPAGLPSMGSHRVGHDSSDLAAASAVSEKTMAPHSSTLAWKIPWTEEPGRLQSTGS